MGEFKFFSKIHVAGNCEKCKSRIENRVKREKGVISAEWHMLSQTLEIEYEYPLMKIEEIVKILLSLGHDTDSFKAEDGIYQSLPKSCRYRYGRN